jgi:ABC-2 type transport system permease protein
MALDKNVIKAIAVRTFRQSIESPIAYIVAIIYYLAVGIMYGLNFFLQNQATIDGIGFYSLMALWFFVPVLTMGLIADEIRTGTYELLSTLPVRDVEIVIGKYVGFAWLSAGLTLGLFFFPVFVKLFAGPLGLDWGAAFGTLLSIYMLMLVYGAIGLFASSLGRHLVVTCVIGWILCTVVLLVGQMTEFVPGFLSRAADFAGIMSHISTMSRGVLDFRDVAYFATTIGFFLYLTVVKLSTRRF